VIESGELPGGIGNVCELIPGNRLESRKERRGVIHGRPVEQLMGSSRDDREGRSEGEGREERRLEYDVDDRGYKEMEESVPSRTQESMPPTVSEE
jgi:hypothetical protein